MSSTRARPPDRQSGTSVPHADTGRRRRRPSHDLNRSPTGQPASHDLDHGRLSQHVPFVLVIDSYRFRVTSACGKALGMATYLLDRWTDVPFIHLEPFRYSIVTDTPVIAGSLTDPHEVDAAAAWGVAGDRPWGPLTMPWVFIVDANGTVRAKYQGVMGTDDIDVIVSMLTNR